MKKKGQIRDIAFFLILVFTVVFTLLTAKIIMDKFNDALTEDGMHTTESKAAMEQMQTAFPTFDNMILVVVILLAAGLIITSFFIPTHPVFLVVNIIGIFFLCFIGMLLSNMYSDIIDNADEYSAVYSTFPKMNFIMNKLPWIAAILVSVITVVQYSKFRSGG